MRQLAHAAERVAADVIEGDMRSFGVPADVLVVREAYAVDWCGVPNTVVHAALTEGREFVAA